MRVGEGTPWLQSLPLLLLLLVPLCTQGFGYVPGLSSDIGCSGPLYSGAGGSGSGGRRGQVFHGEYFGQGFCPVTSEGFCLLNSSRLEQAESTCSCSSDECRPSFWEDELGPVRVVGEVSDEVIVRFTEYKDALVHKEKLEGILEGHGWEWVYRVNPASAFPTDFGVLKLEQDCRDSILDNLNGLSFVKDVSVQVQYTRALTSEGDAREKEETGSHQSQAHDHLHIRKSPGRFATGLSFTEEWHIDDEGNTSTKHEGRQLLSQKSKLTSMFGAEKLWAKGFTGAKVKMAVFDTGVRADHPHFRNIMERTDWTNDGNLNDNLGHGTFVAGVISSQDPQCLGFAPDAEIYAFRVFTDAQVSYTSWFLDAFNYAIATAMNVLNLSIGGPDYLDRPFVEKVWEMTANKIIMVSAIGNDGPFYGTLNNPADQSDVIGVGGIDYSDHIAVFSSRGMTTWEIPHGYGRVKPDVVAYGREVIGSRITSGCKSLSGTSVASPVVAGAVCLLASVIPEDIRWHVLNPASMKQALVEGAARLDGPNMFEQGAGRLNLLASYDVLVNYEPRASVFPNKLDFTDCPYLWPFCHQPMYAGAMPVIFNATILNGMGVMGSVEGEPLWVPSEDAGNFLDIQFTYSDYIWPWTGYLGLHMRVKPEGSNFQGIIEGNVLFTVVSSPGKGEKHDRRSDCVLPVRVAIIPTPQREKRILWDQFHSIRYPPGYIPRDSLDVRNDILDWHGDHLHTNFHGMFDNLRDAGYFVEILGSPFTCFDATQYGTLLLVDLEDEYHPEEVAKLKNDVEVHGLGLIVFADWYHVDTMIKMKFFDDNTRSWWTPATGGANIPALNDLLAPFGIAFGDTILNGPYSIGGERIHYASGTDIVRFPAGGFVHRFLFQDSFAMGLGLSTSRAAVRPQVELPILGAVEAANGRVTVYGDSNCLDSSHNLSNCYWLLRKLLNFTSHKVRDPVLFTPANQLLTPLGGPETVLPSRRDDVNLTTYSLVLDHDLQCGLDSPLEVQQSKGYVLPAVPPRRVAAGKVHYPVSLDREQIGSVTNSSLYPPQVSVELHVPVLVSAFITKEEESSSVKSSAVLPNESLAQGIKVQIQQEPESTGDLRSGERRERRRSTSQQTTKNGVHLRFDDERNVQLDGSLLAVQWLFPVVVCALGIVVLVTSLWRVRQRKRRRTRKAAGRGLLP